jgi:hypothetical protein
MASRSADSIVVGLHRKEYESDRKIIKEKAMKNAEFRNILMSHPTPSSGTANHKPANRSISRLAMTSVLAIWFGLVLVLGAAGAFVGLPGDPPFPILVGVVLPLIIFLCLFWITPTFRDVVLNLDLSLAATIQGWRFAGIGFLALYAHDILPGVFAWPAGLGDIAIGLTAPWLALALVHDPKFAASRSFIVWNLFGILDLVIAVGTGALNSVLALGVTTAPMARLPLVLIPAYFVPLFVMLHLATLFQARRAAVSTIPERESNRVHHMTVSHCA